MFQFVLETGIKYFEVHGFCLRRAQGEAGAPR